MALITSIYGTILFKVANILNVFLHLYKQLHRPATHLRMIKSFCFYERMDNLNLKYVVLH